LEPVVLSSQVVIIRVVTKIEADLVEGWGGDTG